MNQNCTEFEGLIAGALYGSLPPADQTRLDAHLRGCENCRRERDDLAKTIQVLGQAEVEAIDNQGDAFIKAVHRKLGQKTHRRLPAKVIVRKSAWALPFAVAAATILVAFGVFLMTRPKPPQIDIAVQPPTPVVDPVPAPRPPDPVPPPPVVAPKPVAPSPDPAPAPKPVPPPPAPTPDPVAPPVDPPAPAPAPAPVPAPAPRETVAVMAQIESVQGEVAVQTEAGRVAGKAAFDLIPGQEILTGGKSSFAVVKVLDGTRIVVSAESSLRLVADLKNNAGRTFLLSRGTLRADVAKQPATAPMIFSTPNAEARVLGTELVLFAGAESTRLEVRTGKVRLTRREDGASADVTAGHAATAPKTGSFSAKPARVSQGLQALYLFHEGQGAVVHDVSGAAAPLDLRILKGRTSWSAQGLSVDGMPMIKSDGPARRLIDACRKSQEVTVEAWVQPSRAVPDFEGAILSLSTDVEDRNFALAQNAGAWEAALRTANTDGGGRPPLSAGKGSSEAKLTHVLFTRTASGQERLYVNGVERASRVRAGAFTSWNEAFHLFMANESHEERPWSGTYRLAAIYSEALTPAEVARNFKVGVE